MITKSFKILWLIHLCYRINSICLFIHGWKENAKRVFEQSLEDMSKIDTKRLESIKNLKDNKIKFEGICNGLIEPITKQEQLCIDSSENTDTMLIEITGKELLEAYEDGN